MSQISLYWHDYETLGIDPQRDRPVQFAGIRTDLDFNIIDDPLVIYCQLSEDTLPHPDACVITGITPDIAAQQGVCEAEFIRRIHEQISTPDTCTVGYNSLRFDDEFTRNCLYRNFYDPYAREWQNGNSRWDIIDIARAAKALRPDGIQWPVNEDGKPVFRLDQLTVINGIAHESAHDALADVHATIAFARLIKHAQPRLYTFLWQNRLKAAALKLLEVGSFKPVVHISGKYPAAENCLAIVLPICKHPTNPNGVIVYNLAIDPEPMLSLSVDDVQQRIFTAIENLPEGVSRIPLKTVHINKCPVLAPVSVIRPEDAKRLDIDLALCEANIEKIKSVTGLSQKLAKVFANQSFGEQGSDPDLAIYSGGFFSDADKQKMARIRLLSPEKLAATVFNFTDKRFPEMLFRYRARNFRETLSTEEQLKWKQFCINRLTGHEPGAGITIKDYFARLDELKAQKNVNPVLIDKLEAFALEKMSLLGIDNLKC